MSSEKQIDAIVLVYNADWSLRGGAEYLLELVRGSESCALCDITHKTVFTKPQWKACSADLGAPVELLYRNQLDRELKEIIQDDYPAVVARMRQGYVKLLGREELEACDGEPQKLFSDLMRRRDELGLS